MLTVYLSPGLGIGSCGVYVQEMHKVTAAEVIAGYFMLVNNPVAPAGVAVTDETPTSSRKINKQCVGGTGATPDFDVLSTKRVYFKNVAPGAGLSGVIVANDILIIDYFV